ncbi:MAG: hypothetical protein UU77_C0001G0016 [candidate division WWE3 bacterium GW2011_GWC1_41_7]|uniref:DUF1189 domain-containing protein n=1 Tax=candidate division WWE3 bacterium GW2011_GWC1_41_7 TaxID=1619119 RepID=A0A0G0ZHH6_UNCKA|nr:MAG: hypothetical protein UU77_C0001G0016 [candidate division WWE3 bacterium GW2011_GWC1_41_7]
MNTINSIVYKIKAFFYVFYRSLTSVKYYQDVVRATLNFSMKYFFTISALAALLVTVGTVVPMIPTLRDTISNFIEQGRTFYPDELVITSADGKLSVNQPEPYMIPFPDIPEVSDQPDTVQFENLVVFDSQGTLDDLENYKTLILVNEANILAKGENKIEVYPLKDMPDGQLTKTEINQALDKIQEIAVYIPYLLASLLFVGVVFYYLGLRLVYLLFVALILMGIGRIKNFDYDYKKYLQLAIHTMTLPLLMDVIFNLVRVPLPIPFWFFLINTIFGIIVIAGLGKNTVSNASADVPTV